MNPSTISRIDPKVDSAAFRSAMAGFASGVTVVTTIEDGVPLGATVSAFTSLSMDPPMLLVCLNRTSETGQAIERVGEFTVNVLSEPQSDIAVRFASRSSSKFDDVALKSSATQHPVFAESLVAVRCEVAETTYGGTHRIFVAHAVDVELGPGEPLVYFRGGFGRFAPGVTESAAATQAGPQDG
ncbi:flavin reductase [Rhodococcus fascians]|nr:flavin reductase [Rhodococcus fascians]MBY4114687.1 flavin reductase [Rhodococcus fascians]